MNKKKSMAVAKGYDALVGGISQILETIREKVQTVSGLLLATEISKALARIERRLM